MLGRSRLIWGGAAALISISISFGTGCARRPADDWHQFTIAVVPAMQQIEIATAGWSKINTLTAQDNSSAAVYTESFQIVSDEIIPTLAKAVRILESTEPDTAEVQAARDQFAAGVRQMHDGARELQQAITNIQKGDARAAEPQMRRAQSYMNQGRAMMKEAGRTANALNQKYGRAVIN